jgi:chromosome segregation ATPase
MVANKEGNMPKENAQQPEYIDRYVDVRFQHLEKIVDRMEQSFEKTVNEIRIEVNEIRTEVKEIRTEVKEIKAGNEKLKAEFKADNEKMKAEFKADNEKTKIEIKAEIAEIKSNVAEIKRDNKATRWWVIGTGVAVVFGIATILLAFAQIQTFWMQQVISFALKVAK